MVPPAEAMVSLPFLPSVICIGSLICRHVLPIVYVLFHNKLFRDEFGLVDGAATPWELEDPLPLEEGSFHGFEGSGECTVGARQNGSVEDGNIG